MLNKINRYINLWQNRCYSELPDEAPQEINDLVPSYRRIAIAILKNDLGYIGIEPPKSEYYGILKAIELNKPYKKKHMTRREQQDFIFSLIPILIEKNCYIKGYGDKFRIVTGDHSPYKNISRLDMELLKLNGIVVLDNLVWQINVLANPFSHPIQIQLPSKDK